MAKLNWNFMFCTCLGFDHFKWIKHVGNRIRTGLIYDIIEPHHEKTCLCHMRTTKAQISLRIRAVWSAPLLFAA